MGSIDIAANFSNSVSARGLTPRRHAAQRDGSGGVVVLGGFCCEEVPLWVKRGAGVNLLPPDFGWWVVS